MKDSSPVKQHRQSPLPLSKINLNMPGTKATTISENKSVSHAEVNGSDHAMAGKNSKETSPSTSVTKATNIQARNRTAFYSKLRRQTSLNSSKPAKCTVPPKKVPVINVSIPKPQQTAHIKNTVKMETVSASKPNPPLLMKVVKTETPDISTTCLTAKPVPKKDEHLKITLAGNTYMVVRTRPNIPAASPMNKPRPTAGMAASLAKSRSRPIPAASLIMDKPLPTAGMAASLAKSRSRPIPGSSSQKAKQKKRKPQWEQDEYAVNVVKKLRSKFHTEPSKKNFKGPYVRLTKSRINPTSVTVVNGSLSSDKQSQRNSGSKHVQSIHLENFKVQDKWDASKVDPTWVCVICGKANNHKTLGDLFGPYLVDASHQNIRIPTKVNQPFESFDAIERNKRSEHTSTSTLVKSRQKSSEIVLTCEKSEVWVHEDCVLWAHGVCLLPGGVFRGLEEAVTCASVSTCSFCGETGATIGCMTRRCSKQYHYLCASQRGCLMLEDNFTMYCQHHKNQ